MGLVLVAMGTTGTSKWAGAVNSWVESLAVPESEARGLIDN
ncbi:hypothetical protein [Vulcanisaeta souniana]|nr:hypothetical protein [Vulcanisaeta souniana]